MTALRLRLGLRVADFPGEQTCGGCGMRITADDLGPHALLCGKGRRTTAHNRIRDHLADLVRVSDGSAQIEVQWARAVDGVDPPLDERRPADILTSAAPLGGVGSVALDVGVTTPFTAEALRSAELDVLEAYRTKKLRKYADAADAARWRYWPVVISAFGRAHAEAKKAVHRLSLAAARRYGDAKASTIESAWSRNCGTLLMERASSMVRRCRPTVPLPAALGGVADDDAGVWPAKRRRRAANGVPAVGADGPTAPLGD